MISKNGLGITALEIDVVGYKEGGTGVAMLMCISVWVKEAYQLAHIVMT